METPVVLPPVKVISPDVVRVRFVAPGVVPPIPPILAPAKVPEAPPPLIVTVEASITCVGA